MHAPATLDVTTIETLPEALAALLPRRDGGVVSRGFNWIQERPFNR
jgi:hypothetical protein